MSKGRRNPPKTQKKGRVLKAIVGLLVAGLALYAIAQWRYGGRIWWRIAATVTVNGRPAREASVYRSAEGTLLIDLRHSPSHADTEGGGYLVQPFWNRLRALSKGYYSMHGPLAIVDEMWMPSVEVGLDSDFMKLDPKLQCTSTDVSFEGMDHDFVVVHGNGLLLPWPQ